MQGILNSFSFNAPRFTKYFFYTFNFYLALRGLCTLSWAIALYLEVKHLNNIVSWKRDAAISLEVLIVVGSVLIVFAFCGGGFSILFFDNAKFRNRWTYTSCTTVTFAVLFLIMMIMQSTAAIYYLVVVMPRDESGVDELNTYNKYKLTLKYRIYELSSFILVLTVIELIGMINALCLVNSIKKINAKMNHRGKRHFTQK